MIEMLRWHVPILGYHRVGPSRGDHVPTVSAEAFERQMAYLARHRYTVLDLPELAEKLARREAIGRKTVAITFDDGYEGTATIAAPILDRYGFHATVFVTPSEVATPGFMTWEQITSMARNGFTIGSHTMHHTYLPMVSHEKARYELMESKRVLEGQLQQPVRWLSYPIGGYTSDVQSVAREVGYEAACTTNRGISKRVIDLFAIRRIKMVDRDRDPVRLWAKLSGWYDAFRRLEPPA